MAAATKTTTSTTSCHPRATDPARILVLRHQLKMLHCKKGGPRFRPHDRMLLARPERFLRAGHRPHPSVGEEGPGGPSTPKDLRDLVIRIAPENARWGYLRIRGDLKKLGQDLPATTIILGRAGIHPAPRRDGPSWAQFLSLARSPQASSRPTSSPSTAFGGGALCAVPHRAFPWMRSTIIIYRCFPCLAGFLCVSYPA